MMNVAKELAEEHYVDLSSKPFYPGLVNYIIRWGAWAAAHAANSSLAQVFHAAHWPTRV